MQSSRYARGFSSQSRGTLPSDSSRIYLPKDHTKIGTFSLPALSSSKQQTLVRIMDLGPPLRTAWVRLAQCARSNVQSIRGLPAGTLAHVSCCHTEGTLPQQIHPLRWPQEPEKPIAAAPNTRPAVLWHSNSNCPSLSDLINH